MTHPIQAYTPEKIDDILKNAHRAGKVLKNDDGHYMIVMAEAGYTPWHYQNSHFKGGCAYWNSVVTITGFGKGVSFIPLACLECWKTVVRPRTVKELYQLLDLQNQMGVASKCGIETRGEVFGLYGGYFYSESLKEGRECYRVVRAGVDKYISPDVPIILKRGCTEYEIGHGDSLEWIAFDGQAEIERYIAETVEMVQLTGKQSEDSREQVHDSWNRFAYAAGDLTYLEFTDGVRPYKAYRTYHENGGKCNG